MLIELENSQWQKCFGHNNFILPKLEYLLGGGVSFKEHLNKPLTEKLWCDLRYRLKVNLIYVLKYNDEDKRIFSNENCAIIYLDENKNVTDIFFKTN